MQHFKWLRWIAICAYMFIFIPGWMIAMPVILFIITFNPLFLFSTAGLAVQFFLTSIKSRTKKLIADLCSFILFIMPFTLLNYKAAPGMLYWWPFYLPLIIFIIAFSMSFVLLVRKKA